MKPEEGWVTGPALEVVKALRGIRVGDLIRLRDMPIDWYLEKELDTLGVATDNTVQAGLPYAVQEIDESRSCLVGVEDTFVHYDEIEAWKPRIVSSTKKE